jgi:hypothetical protein
MSSVLKYPPPVIFVALHAVGRVLLCFVLQNQSTFAPGYFRPTLLYFFFVSLSCCRILYFVGDLFLHVYKVKSKAIPVTGCGAL